MIHFTSVDEVKIGNIVVKCEPRKFKSTMDMIHFIAEFQCTPIEHLYIYRAGDYPTQVEDGVLVDYKPILTYGVYRAGEV